MNELLEQNNQKLKEIALEILNILIDLKDKFHVETINNKNMHIMIKDYLKQIEEL